MGNFPPSALREPPRPPRHHRTDVARVSTNMGKGNADQKIRRCKKRKILSKMESLPDDLLFEILVRLPAQDISKSAMLVCWKWYNAIQSLSFIYAHLEHATCGLLLQCKHGPEQLIFMAMRRGRIEISNLSYKATCGSSCNGLVWEYRDGDADADADVSSPNVLVITNPATKQHFVLPPFSHEIIYDLCGIAYVASSREYKVVMTCAANNDESDLEVWQSFILTVGVDGSWRSVSTQHLSPAAKKVLSSTPLINAGFMHWAMDGTQVLTLNVETEIIAETPVPVPVPQNYQGKDWSNYFYMSTGRYLSLLITHGKFLWEVWEMKPEIGEWTKLPNINLEAQKCAFEQFGWKDDEILVPVGWLEYPKVLVFGVRHLACACIFYNLLTHEIDSTKLPYASEHYDFLVHKNSLVWLDGQPLL